MLLTEVHAINYKSAQKTKLSLKSNSPSILIGENDCGKTTSLNAIRLLLDHSFSAALPNTKSDKNDLSHTYLSKSDINEYLAVNELPQLFDDEESEDADKYIICVGKFEIEGFELSSEVISNHLHWVIESTAQNPNFNIHFYKARIIDASTGESNVYYAHQHPTEPSLNSIYSMTQAAINTAMSSYNPEHVSLRNDNGEGPHSIYEKMRSILETVECSYQFVKFSDDTKHKKWRQDLTIFPEYAYLSWHESLEGITNAAKTILADSIETEVARAKKVSSFLSSKAQKKINESLDALGIQNEVPSIEGISATVNFELKNQLTDLFVQKQNAEDIVHIDNQGEGIKRQIWFALLKLQAVKEVTNNKRYIWCFDEPETHLHPKAQREFFKTLRTLAAKNFQVLVSTHSSVFVDASNLDEINSFRIDNSYTTIRKSQSVAEILHTIGVLNSDFLFYDKFLMVEGDTEEVLIPSLYQKYTGKTLRQENIQIINLRGSKNTKNADYLLESLIDGFASKEDLAIYIFDADTNKVATDTTFVVGKQDLEDSLPTNIWPRIVDQVFEGKISVSEEEIIQILSNIPAATPGKPFGKNDKFAPKLKSLICQKLSDIGETSKISDWPNKSKEWGGKLSEHLHVEDIPQPIIQAFDTLH